MFDRIDFQPEPYASNSPPMRTVKTKYERLPATSYSDKPSQLTARQTNFYHNLIDMALALKSDILPVDFTANDGRRMYIDHGCIKIAEYAGFIRKLTNDTSGVVSTIRLSWRVQIR